MPAIRITAFSGERPKIAPRLLADTQAQIAKNCKLWSGEIEPVKDSELVYTSSKDGPLKSAIRLIDSDGNDVWFAWEEVVDAVRGPIASDTSQRTYYTGHGEPRVTNLSLGIAGGTNRYPATYFVLGIPMPDTAPTVAAQGGSGTAESRAYVYTFVSKTTLPNGVVLDEEGPPSPVTTEDGFENSTSWDLSDMDAAPPNSGTVSAVENSAPSVGYVRLTLNTVRHLRVGENITFASVGGMTDLNDTFAIVGVDSATSKVWVSLTTAQTYTSGGTWAREAPHNTSGMKRRIYRTDAVGTYRLVAEIDVATTTYSDTLANAALALKTSLVSTSYYQPPANMHSLISLPNGVMCGISGNELCASEPYQPHAWPPEWRKTANYEGVSLGNVGTMVVMTTTGRHQVAHGVDPSVWTLDESKGRPYPCVSKRSTVSMENGVVWATHDGLATQTPNGSALFTEGVFEYEEWQALGPSSMFGALYSGRYVAGFQRTGSDVQELLIIDPSEQAFLVLATVQASGLYADLQNGQLYVLLGTNVRQWDSDVAARLSSDWMSKEFVFPTPMNLGAAKIDANFTLTPSEQNALEALRDAAIAANDAILAGTGWIGGEVNDEDVNDIDVNESPLGMVPAATYDQIWFYLYANGELKFAKRVQSNKAFTLPSGFKSDVYAVRVITNLRVKAVLFGSTMKSLAEA